MEAQQERLGENSDPIIVILRRRLPLHLGENVEVREQAGEEEKELGFGEGLAEALALADGERNQVVVLLARASGVKEPLGPEHFSIAPVGTLEQLHHERHEKGASGDGHPVHNDVLGAAVVDPVGHDVGVALDLHQDCFGVGQVGLVLQRGRLSLTNDMGHLLLNFLLHFWIARHVEKSPCQGCGGCF